MALQDDIFDLQDALKGKLEAKSLDRLLVVFYELEEENENLNKVVGALKEGARALKYLTEFTRT